MYERILVPVDESDHARLAAEHALSLAEAFDADVRLLTVVDIEAAAGPFDAGGVTEEFVEEQRADGRERLDGTVAALGDPAGVETEVVEGSPAEAIVDDAEEYGADLIVMGTHGRSGVSRYLSGSVAEEVVRHAGVPVLTLEATEAVDEAPAYEDVLAATDGSGPALAAADSAIAIADAFGGTLHALSVVDDSAFSALSSDESRDDAADSLREQGERAVEAVADRAADNDAATGVETAVERGDPAETILDYADERDVGLVVVGRGGRSGVEDVLLGSTAQRVVRHADVPVLVADGE